MQSMTGYGRGEANANGSTLTIELSSVNRRHLEVSTSLPREAQGLERPLVERVRAGFGRGKIHLTAQLASSQATAFAFDEEALAETFVRFQAVARKLGVPFEPSGDALVRLAAMHREEMVGPAAEELVALAGQALDGAMAELRAMRLREGAALAADIQGRIQTLRTATEVIRGHTGEAVPRYREMLLTRLKQAGLEEINLDDERVLREVALFADRCDISEELTRLTSHLDQFELIVATESAEPIGRKLEFLLQEIHREVNTIGSKSTQLEVSRQAIEAKNEVERLREQLQNVE